MQYGEEVLTKELNRLLQARNWHGWGWLRKDITQYWRNRIQEYSKMRELVSSIRTLRST